MVLTPHILIGAAIGARIRHPLLIIGLGLLSHLILDKLPHWDYHNKGISGFRRDKNFKNLVIDLIKAGIDGLIGVMLVVFLLYRNRMVFQTDKLIFIMLGVVSATLPDFFLFLVHLFFPTKTAEKILAFHSNFLHCKKEGYQITFLNLATGIFIILLSIFLLSV